MKTQKIQLIGLIFLIIAMFATTSCGKDDSYCAQCYESSINMDATFCGTSKAVDTYMETLKETGSQYGQRWSCSKVKN